MSDRLPILGGGESRSRSNTSEMAEADERLQPDAQSSDGAEHEASAYTPRSHSGSMHQSGHTYTELMGGSVPCPSCHGSGRIPHELEGQLVALIPVTDKRLKPRRTWMWVLVGMIAVASVFGLTAFFLVPRTISIYSDSFGMIEEVEIVDFLPGRYVKLNFTNDFTVANNNYYSVRVLNATNTVTNKFDVFKPEKIGDGFNITGTKISARSNDELVIIDNAVKIDGGTLNFCESWFRIGPRYITMEFDITVTFQYMSHIEQNTLTVNRQVCCVPSGNCTAAALED